MIINKPNLMAITWFSKILVIIYVHNDGESCPLSTHQALLGRNHWHGSAPPLLPLADSCNKHSMMISAKECIGKDLQYLGSFVMYAPVAPLDSFQLRQQASQIKTQFQIQFEWRPQTPHPIKFLIVK